MSLFTPDLIESALQALLTGQLTDVNVGSIGELDIDDADQLVCDPPMVRTFYVGTSDVVMHDNQALNYDANHVLQIWCAAEDLHSKEAGREATKLLVAQVMPIVIGARLALSDGSKSEPVRWLGISGVPDDTLGRIYVITVGVPGIAQFPGTNG